MARTAQKLMSVDFEVFGRVQGVFFRKYTQRKATQLGLVGWVKNTDHNTVVGTVQGDSQKIPDMKNWLEKEGSPKSQILKCVFTNQRDISATDYQAFVIEHESSHKAQKVRTHRKLLKH